MTKSNSPPRCTSGSAFNLCVYVKTSPSQNAPKSQRLRIGQNVPITFPASYSTSAMVMYDSKLPWARVRFGPVPLASCGNTDHKWIGVNSQAEMSFTVLSQIPRWEHSGTVVQCLNRGRGFEPHLRLCVVTLSKIHESLLSTGSTQEDSS